MIKAFRIASTELQMKEKLESEQNWIQQRIPIPCKQFYNEQDQHTSVVRPALMHHKNCSVINTKRRWWSQLQMNLWETEFLLGFMLFEHSCAVKRWTYWGLIVHLWPICCLKAGQCSSVIILATLLSCASKYRGYLMKFWSSIPTSNQITFITCMKPIKRMHHITTQLNTCKQACECHQKTANMWHPDRASEPDDLFWNRPKLSFNSALQRKESLSRDWLLQPE